MSEEQISDIFKAISRDDIKEVLYLYSRDKDISITRIFIDSAIDNKINIVKYYLDNGMVNLYSAILHSIEINCLEAVNMLLDLGSDIKKIEKVALQIAGEEGNIEMIKLLIKKGANIFSDKDETMIYASGRGRLNAVKYLLSIGYDPSKVTVEFSCKYLIHPGRILTLYELYNKGIDISKFPGMTQEYMDTLPEKFDEIETSFSYASKSKDLQYLIMSYI